MDNALTNFAKNASEVVQVMDAHPAGAMLLVVLIWILTRKPPPS